MPYNEQELSEYANNHVRKVCEMLDIESSFAVVEWQELKTVISSHFEGKTNFIRLCKMLSSDSLEHIHAMKKLLDILLHIPSSNADVEWVWSDMKDIIDMESLSLKKMHFLQSCKYVVEKFPRKWTKPSPRLSTII